MKLILLSIFCALSAVKAMDCNFGRSSNFVDQLAHTCPRPLADPSSNEYCCFDTDFSFYCCSAGNFALHIFIAILIVVLPIMILCSLVACCWRMFCR